MNAEDLALVARKLEELVGAKLHETDDSHELDDALSEDQLTDFMDRLEAHDVACDVYLPVEFDGRLEIGERSVGSAHALLEALEELRDELDIDEEEELDAEEELDLEVIDEQLSYAWHLFARAANACVARQIPLHVLP